MTSSKRTGRQAVESLAVTPPDSVSDDILVSELIHSEPSPQSWQEIYERPRFVRDVEHGSLDRIVTHYHLYPLQQCGLKSCRQWHNGGFVVALEDGNETIIGNGCGSTHFGVKFDRSKATYQMHVNARMYRTNILAKREELPRIKEQLYALREEAGELYAQMKNYMTRWFDPRTSKALHTRAGLRGGSRVTQEIRLSAEERKASGQSHRSETLFYIAGVQAAKSWKLLADSRLSDLRNQIWALEHADVDSAGLEKLRKLSAAAVKIDDQLIKANEAIKDCRRFLSRNNISRINSNKPEVQTL